MRSVKAGDTLVPIADEKSRCALAATVPELSQGAGPIVEGGEPGAATGTLGFGATGFNQGFEFTHELAWKTLKDFLEARGTIALYGSKDATREAFAAGLIEDGETWMAMIQSRNQTTHTYDEEAVRRIAAVIVSHYLTLFERFEERFAELEREETAQ